MKKIYRIRAECQIEVTLELDEEDDDAAMVEGAKLLQAVEDYGEVSNGMKYLASICSVGTKHAWIHDVENEDGSAV